MAKLQDIQTNIMRLAAQRQQQLQQQAQYSVADYNMVQPMQEVHDVILHQPVYTTKPTLPSTTPILSTAISHTDNNPIKNNEPANFISSNKYTNETTLDSFIKSLIPGKDYGQIPGINSTNNILFRSGALKIIKFCGFNLSVQLIDKNIDVNTSFISYTVKVSAIDKDGICHYECLGCSNSHEGKFKSKGMSVDSMLISIAQKRAEVGIAKAIISSR